MTVNYNKVKYLTAYLSRVFQSFYIPFNKNLFKRHAIIFYSPNELFTDLYWLWVILVIVQMLSEYLFYFPALHFPIFSTGYHITENKTHKNNMQRILFEKPNHIQKTLPRERALNSRENCNSLQIVLFCIMCISTTLAIP